MIEFNFNGIHLPEEFVRFLIGGKDGKTITKTDLLLLVLIKAMSGLDKKGNRKKFYAKNGFLSETLQTSLHYISDSIRKLKTLGLLKENQEQGRRILRVTWESTEKSVQDVLKNQYCTEKSVQVSGKISTFNNVLIKKDKEETPPHPPTRGDLPSEIHSKSLYDNDDGYDDIPRKNSKPKQSILDKAVDQEWLDHAEFFRAAMTKRGRIHPAKRSYLKSNAEQIRLLSKEYSDPHPDSLYNEVLPCWFKWFCTLTREEVRRFGLPLISNCKEMREKHQWIDDKAREFMGEDYRSYNDCLGY